MLAVDNIKIKYSEEGYLPDYPPHLISNKEMCEAFLPSDATMQKAQESGQDIWSYFQDIYPLANESLANEYNLLVNAIKYHFVRFLTTIDSFYLDLPNWVYSYMLGHVVNQQSSQEDRHYFLSGIGMDNIDDIIDEAVQLKTYQFSQRWYNKLSKSSKLEKKSDILSGLSSSEQTTVLGEFEYWGVTFDDYNNIVIRPPSMFGEQTIIKLIRLSGGAIG